MTTSEFSNNKQTVCKPTQPNLDGLSLDEALVYCEIHRNTRFKSFKKNRSVGAGNMPLSEIARNMRHRYQIGMSETYKIIDKLKNYEGNSLLDVSEVTSKLDIPITVVATKQKFPQFNSADRISLILNEKSQTKAQSVASRTLQP